MTKRLRWLLVVLAALALVAAGCGDDESEPQTAEPEPEAAEPEPEPEAPEPEPEPEAPEPEPEADAMETDAMETDAMETEPEPLRVAVVTPSAKNDLAFSQSIVDALHRMEADGLFSEVAVSEGLFIVEDAGVALRDYAEAGFDLVIGHGSQYGALIEQIAPDFPDTAFSWGTAVETFGLSNVSSYTTASDQGAYVMGVMAAALAGGADVGIIGPIEVGDAKLFVDGFLAGVEAGGGAARAVYTDSFADIQLAAEAAQSFIDNGAAVLTGTAQMTVGAIGVANQNGVAWFGTQSNQTQVAPDVVVANQVYRWDAVLGDLVADIQAGQLGGSAYKIDFANGGLVMEYNDDYPLDPDIRALGDEAVAGFTDGSMSTGVG